MNAPSMLDRALALLECGFSVFPLGAYGEPAPQHVVSSYHGGDQAEADRMWAKRPRVAWRAFQQAAPSEETVRSWWEKWPNSNIGLACGALVVVDADSEDSAKWCMENLPPTPWRVRTAKGKHFYFSGNSECAIRNSTNPQARIDVRGHGGYVVAGGSRHASGTWYEDEIDPTVRNIVVSDLPQLTKENVAAIEAYRHSNLSASPQLGPAGGNLVGFDANSYRTKATGEPVIEGGRNNAAASLAGQHFRAGLSLRDTKKLLDGWNASNPQPLSDAELNTVIASVKRTHEANHPGEIIPLESPAARETATPGNRPQPFPKHLLTPPGLVGQIASYITRTAIKPQPVLSLGAALALCGTAMGRKVRTTGDLRPNPYIVAIADSGAGKEHPRQAIKRLFSDAGALFLLGAEDLASDAGLFATIYKQPSVLLCLDEVGRFFKMITNDRAPPHLVAIQTMLMKLTGSAVGPFLDKVRAENAEAAVRVVDQPNVCLYGSTVPGRLFQALKKDDITDGFLPRILCFHSDDPDPDKQKVIDKIPPQEIVDQLARWAKRSINAYPAGNLDTVCNPLLVDSSAAAQSLFDTFEAANRLRKANARGTGIDTMWSRADEHAIRLALIVACGCSYDNPVIDRQHAEWACEVVEFVLKRAIAEIDVNVADSAHELIVKKVLAFIRAKGTVNKSQLARRFQDLKVWEIEAALDSLRNGERISDPEVIAAGSKGGRPKTVWKFLQ